MFHKDVLYKIKILFLLIYFFKNIKNVKNVKNENFLKN